MDPLATPSDVEARLGRDLTTTENLRIDALLADASANVRRVSTQMFTEVEDDVVTVQRGKYGKIRLPQRPVTDVASITDLNGHVLSWTRANEVVTISCNPLNAWEIEPYRIMPLEVIVTYTHGGTVPDQIIGVVCSIVARALGTDPSMSGMTQEGIDGYSYTTGSAAAQGGFGMLASEREVCEAFKRPSSPILMGV